MFLLPRRRRILNCFEASSLLLVSSLVGSLGSLVTDERYASVPHVGVGARYDDAYLRPLEISSVSELGPRRTLVAFVDEGKPCAAGFDGLVLRNGQRFLAKEFLDVAKAVRQRFVDPWPPSSSSDCAVGFYRGHDLAKVVPIASFFGEESALATVRDLVQEMARATVTLRNSLKTPVTFRWYDQAYEESAFEEPYKHVATLNGDSSMEISSFIGHTFGAFQGERAIAKFTARNEEDAFVVVDDASKEDASNSKKNSCPSNPQDHNAPLMYERHVNDVGLALREDVFDLSLQKRFALNDVQKRLVPNVTEDGFKLTKMPAELYDRALAWYDANHARAKHPESDGGPLYNQRFVPTWHTPLPPDLKADVFDGLKTIMEQWAPTTIPLHGTSAYGVRTYERDSYLHLHTDTANTHVVSGIINIAQQADAPWPVQIFDHRDRLHALVMEPGDLLLYESAKLPHGRVEPFRGSYYANIFVHYAPDNWHVPL